MHATQSLQTEDVLWVAPHTDCLVERAAGQQRRAEGSHAANEMLVARQRAHRVLAPRRTVNVPEANVVVVATAGQMSQAAYCQARDKIVVA